MAFGGVTNLPDELQKVHGRVPLFENNPVLFTPKYERHSVIHYRGEEVSPSKWAAVFKCVDETSQWSLQIPFMRETIGKLNANERVQDKM